MKQQIQAKKALFLAALTIASPVVLSTLNITKASALGEPAIATLSENEQKIAIIKSVMDFYNSTENPNYKTDENTQNHTMLVNAYANSPRMLERWSVKDAEDFKKSAFNGYIKFNLEEALAIAEAAKTDDKTEASVAALNEVIAEIKNALAIYADEIANNSLTDGEAMAHESYDVIAEAREAVNNLVSQAEEDMRLALEEEMRLQAEQEKALADAMEKAAAEAAAAANQAKTETATEIAAQATSTPVAPAKSVSISAPNTGVKKADDGALALLTTFSGLLSVIFVVARKK
jgi:hypothetical protein